MAGLRILLRQTSPGFAHFQDEKVELVDEGSIDHLTFKVIDNWEPSPCAVAGYYGLEPVKFRRCIEKESYAPFAQRVSRL